MDRLEKNKKILEQVLKEIEASHNKMPSNIKTELFIGTTKHTYIILMFGWEGLRFVHFVAFHFDIKPDGKIWFYQNRTDELIVERMEALGFDSDDMVYALTEPYSSEFVTA